MEKPTILSILQALPRYTPLELVKMQLISAGLISKVPAAYLGKKPQVLAAIEKRQHVAVA